jgi:hypothetical protein
VGNTVNALCAIDSSGGKVFVEDEYCTATSDTLVEIALEGLTTKVQPETWGRGPMFEEFASLLIWLLPIILLAVIILPQMIRILREY